MLYNGSADSWRGVYLNTNGGAATRTSRAGHHKVRSVTYGYSLCCIRLQPLLRTVTASVADSLKPALHTVTASVTYGDSLCYTRRQPSGSPHTVTAAIVTYGHSLCYIRSQPP